MLCVLCPGLHKVKQSKRVWSTKQILFVLGIVDDTPWLKGEVMCVTDYLLTEFKYVWLDTEGETVEAPLQKSLNYCMLP